ncbi:MAG: ABC transporter ATP-binding protein [Firmicutes bacterium]|nr:ABC transporter ATP-binding protein [Bacillota bacterium]
MGFWSPQLRCEGGKTVVAIQTTNLTKDFNGVRAVNDLSLSIETGEIYGFIGLNGAGKTTTIRMLLGMCRPTGGRAYVLGKRIKTGCHHLWSDVGYIVEAPHSYPELTVWENLKLFHRLRGIEDKGRLDEVVARLRLGPYVHRKAAHLSLGNLQRLGLAKALMHGPRILILDEPTNGLDPAGMIEIRKLLKELALKGVTVFLSSHLLGEVAKLATRIGIVHEGRLIEELDSESLDQRVRKRLVLKTRNNARALSVLEEAGIKVKPDQKILSICDEHVILKPETAVRHLVSAGLPPIHVEVETEDLETYFVRIVSRGKGK